MLTLFSALLLALSLPCNPPPLLSLAQLDPSPWTHPTSSSRPVSTSTTRRQGKKHIHHVLYTREDIPHLHQLAVGCSEPFTILDLVIHRTKLRQSAPFHVFRIFAQWNLSIEDTIGTQLAVLYREVSLIQR